MIIRFRASGRVQGVGYRAFARDQAQALGLAGWVKNDADGAVSGAAEGDAGPLAAYRDLLQRGPLWGRVDDLAWSEVDESEAGAAQSLPRPFQIRR